MRPETKARYPDNWAAISAQTIELAQFVCQVCGRVRGEGGAILTVHHVDYDPANNDPGNLVVLCQGCHLRVQAQDLAEATKLNKVEALIRMGQLCFPGMEVKIPKRLDRVMTGKALSRTLGNRFHAQPGIGQSSGPADRAGRG